ncbi:hypothetical protein CRENBAI_014191 [Crenichthys baileyi]|uniref:Uncharacterized protein n=1 Tax=Crenichthys baileyi TaxID=28760 RepID=A0AAV9QZV3_9TELE
MGLFQVPLGKEIFNLNIRSVVQKKEQFESRVFPVIRVPKIRIPERIRNSQASPGALAESSGSRRRCEGDGSLKDKTRGGDGSILW